MSSQYNNELMISYFDFDYLNCFRLHPLKRHHDVTAKEKQVVVQKN